MRSTIFTSVIALIASPVFADQPDLGCYERVYSADHLKSHPEQVVSAIRMLVFDHKEYADRIASMEVLFANQGHVRAAGMGEQLLRQSLFCGQNSSGEGWCSVECDGGGFTVTKQDNSGITFRTDYLMVGDTEGCGGTIDMAEIPGKPVLYRLNRTSEAVCGGLE